MKKKKDDLVPEKNCCCKDPIICSRKENFKTIAILIGLMIISAIGGYALGSKQYQHEAVQKGFGEFKYIIVYNTPVMKYFSWYTLDELLEFYTKEAGE